MLERALDEGHLPFFKRLLGPGGHRVHPMTVGMPTSTPAFQMAAMYGVRPDIPGFHYHDKRRGTDVHFPRAGHAALVEATQAEGRRGILRGGSVYGCVFTGGAENDLFSFAKLKRPSSRGLLRALSAFVIVGWVVWKSVALTLAQLAKALLHVLTHPRGAGQHWQRVMIRIGISVWVRELFTGSVARDLYDGVPAIYVNYLDYDVAAHAFGPHHRAALRSLRYVDSSIRQLRRVLRRVPEHQYDLFILSDHGQAPCTPYSALTGGARFERRLFDEFLDPASAGQPAAATGRQPGYTHGFVGYRIGDRGAFGRVMHYVDRAFEKGLEQREAYERRGVRVISAGPNAFVYVTDTPEPLTIDLFEKRFPGVAADISCSPGVGFVLARSEQGPVCFWRGARYQLGRDDPGPFAGREDRDLILSDVADLVAMPSAGDLVIYGTDAPEGHVSYIPEVGGHAGPSAEEFHTFIVAHSRARVPTITHPVQLYPLFSAYQDSGHEPAHDREL